MKTIEQVATLEYVMQPHKLPSALPSYMFSDHGSQFLHAQTPFIDTDRVGLGYAPVPYYDLHRIAEENRHALRPTERALRNLTRAEKSLSFRVDPNALQYTQISSREQVPRDYRSQLDELQFGNKRHVAPRKTQTFINLNPIRR